MQIDAQRAATEQALQALAEEQNLTAAQREAFERLKRAEAEVNEMTRHILDLGQRRADLQTRIEKRMAILRPLIPVVIRMSEHPAETLLFSGVPVEDAIRGLLILRGLARQAATETRALAEDRDALDVTTKAAAEVASRLAATEAARSFEADALARQLAETRERREAAEQEAAEAAKRASAEAARATSLRAMLQILETQRQLEEDRAREDASRAEREQKTAAAEAARSRQAATGRPTGGTLAVTARAAGQLTPPVAGTLARAWGDPEDGEPAIGQSWRAEPGARVVAPCGGTVAFAEPFLGYGLLVIIDCGGGFHAVLSGLDQATVSPGRTVRDGDPIGTLPATARVAASGGSAAESPVLYFELRKAGRPVNPAPWLQSPGLQSPGLQSPGLQSPGLQSPGLQSLGLKSPG